jgi:hypothetical protein
MRQFLVALAMLLKTTLAASAQGAGPILPPNANTSIGDRLAVTTTAGVRITGRLIADANGALVLRADRREHTIAHKEIDRVTRRHNRVLFGPLIGLGAGLAAGLPAKRRFENEGVNGDLLLAWVVGSGVVIGTVIDLVNGTDRTIYRRTSGALAGLQIHPAPCGAAVRWAIAW